MNLIVEVLENRMVPTIHLHPDHHLLTNVSHSYTPAELNHIYHQDLISNHGAGQTVVIVDAFHNPLLQDSLNLFDKNFGLPDTALDVINVQGAPQIYDRGWGLEEALDVEMVHTAAPYAKIIVVESENDNLGHMMQALGYAKSLHPEVISLSASIDERFITSHVFDKYLGNPRGIMVVSSGDDGGRNVQFPASFPKVLAVGGTNNIFDVGEHGWVASGGGFSKLYPGRSVPDVSSEANNVAVVDLAYRPDRMIAVGGTSVSAPYWGGLIADIDSAAPHLKVTNRQEFYKIHRHDFNDITQGNSIFFKTKPGYDNVTGIGSPRIDKILADIVFAQHHV